MAVMQQNRRNPILLGQDNNALTWLIIINAVIFVIVNFIKIIYFLNFDTNMEAMQNFHLQVLEWFTLPPDLEKLMYRPWTFLSYMFTHESVWQLIGTLLWLWGFGYIFQDLAGNAKLLPVYLYAGLAGGLFYILTANIIPQYSNGSATSAPLMGAGAAVMGIAVATTTLSPGYRIFPMLNGGIPLWVITLIFVAIDYATIASSSGSYAVAHLAGGAMGFLFVYQLRRGHDWSEWMNNFFNWVNDLFNPEKKFSKKPVVHQQFYKETRKPFEKKPHVTQQRLDDLLDKINQEGYNSLTDEEKEFLKKASQDI